MKDGRHLHLTSHVFEVLERNCIRKGHAELGSRFLGVGAQLGDFVLNARFVIGGQVMEDFSPAFRKHRFLHSGCLRRERGRKFVGS